MKNIHSVTILLVIVVFLFIACFHKEHPSVSLPELMQAETMMYEHPDSALHLLQNMEMPDASQKLEHATWALLMTQAKYKMYIKQNDSLVNIAYDYFMKQEDARRKALALYLKGELCYDHRKIEEAQDFFLKATVYAEKTNDYQLCHLIYAQLGNIYILRSYKEYALEAFNKSYQYAQQSQNSKYIIASLIYFGRTYGKMEKFDQSIEYYQKAIEIAQEKHVLKSIVAASNELAGIYIKIKDYQKALYYSRQAVNNNSIGRTKGQINLVMGYIYSEIGPIDSAYYYLNQATLYKSSINTVNAAYHALYDLSKKEQKYQEAIYYNDKFLNGFDSIFDSHKK